MRAIFCILLAFFVWERAKEESAVFNVWAVVWLVLISLVVAVIGIILCIFGV